MKTYDVIVVGSGCGMIASEESVAHGMKVALVDKGPTGGTCLNLGCIPSKLLIYAADRICEIQESRKFGIKAKVEDIDFTAIMDRIRKSTRDDREEIRRGLKFSENPDFYDGEAHFVSDYTLEVGSEKIKGKKIVLASGSRPFILPIKGLDAIDYLTNESLLELTKKPESMIIIGGGYIGVEYAHFFAAIGTRVSIVEMADRLVAVEEPEICELLRKELGQRADIYLNTTAEEVKKSDRNISILVKDKNTGQQKELQTETLLVAVGRRSNADLLEVENTGVETNKRGFIKVNEYLETTKANIWAAGDAIGKYMFTHVANREASLVAHNILHGARVKMDYSAIPYAVFSRPQISSVGMTEAEARKNHKVVVGVAKYYDVAAGEAMVEKEGFAKAVVDEESGKILGFHIIGPYASVIIQEVTNAMASGGHIEEIGKGIHIHPALPELIPATLRRLG